MMTIEDLLRDTLAGAELAMPAMDPLREADALQEAQLLDMRIAAATSTVGLLFEMRTALQLREGNAAVLVGYQARALDWSVAPRQGMTAWTVVGSQPSNEGLTLDFYPAARLRLAAERAAFFIVNVHGIGDAPPDYMNDSAAVIQAGIPR
jgi:hypothetical protein